MELFTIQFVHQRHDRFNLRLAKRQRCDHSLIVEQFQRLPQRRPQVTEIVIPPDLLFGLRFGRFIRRTPLVDHGL
jgi:hypothetical protein